MKKTLYVLMIVALLAGFLVPTVSAAEDTISVIITAAGDVETVTAEVEALGGTVTHVYRNFPMLVADVSNEAAVQLAGMNVVENVSKNQIRTLAPPIVEKTQDGDVLPNDQILGDEISVEEMTVEDIEALPETYYNYGATGANSVWFAPDGNMGQDTIIAIVDTGVRAYPYRPDLPPFNPCIGFLGGRLLEGYNAYPDGATAWDINNHWHGSHVASVSGSACALNLVKDWSGDPEAAKVQNALISALQMHNPDGIFPHPDQVHFPDNYVVPLLGLAPLSTIYPVKVFPQDGSGTPDSIIIDGLDHLLTMKQAGLDIDVVNMSLGGATLFDGFDSYRAPIRALTKAGMLVVTSASNAGPVPNSIGTPATDFRALSVGATDDPVSTRVLREWQGQRYYDMVGWGDIVRPTDDIRMTTFSSRGPLSDGRMGPDVSALGLWNFAVYPEMASYGASLAMRWAGGTSFSSPTVAGGAALLNTWWEQNRVKEKPGKIRNAIILGADPDKISDVFEQRDTGFGYLDVPAAWMLLRANAVGGSFWPVWDHVLYNNIGWDCDDNACVYESSTITLGPAETFDKVFEVHPEIHDEIFIELFDVVGAQDNVFWNTADLYVKSAKRSATPYVIEDIAPIAGGNPYIVDPGSAWVRVRDGKVTYDCGGPCYAPYDANLNWAMEPGQWKVTVAPYDSNNSDVSFRLRITKPFRWDPPGDPWKTHKIKTGQTYYYGYTASGLSKLTFDLAWDGDWSVFPTNDIDLIVIGPDGTVYVDGASLSAPEKLVIDNPLDGTYTVIVDGFEVYGKDFFKLYVTPE